MRGLENKHNLPEESHTSNAYILLYPDGHFRKLGEYDSDHYLTTVVEYHPEPTIEKSRKPILHIHFIDRDLKRSPGRLLTQEELNKYHKFLQDRLTI